jgi:hypothetical protein
MGFGFQPLAQCRELTSSVAAADHAIDRAAITGLHTRVSISRDGSVTLIKEGPGYVLLVHLRAAHSQYLFERDRCARAASARRPHSSMRPGDRLAATTPVLQGKHVASWQLATCGGGAHPWKLVWNGRSGSRAATARIRKAGVVFTRSRRSGSDRGRDSICGGNRCGTGPGWLLLRYSCQRSVAASAKWSQDSCGFRPGICTERQQTDKEPPLERQGRQTPWDALSDQHARCNRQRCQPRSACQAPA